MSGYFARLAAQVRTPVAATARAAAPGPIERHVEVAAATPATATPAAADAAANQATTHSVPTTPIQTPSTAPTAARSAQRSMPPRSTPPLLLPPTASAQAMPAATDPVLPVRDVPQATPAIEVRPVATTYRGATESVAKSLPPVAVSTAAPHQRTVQAVAVDMPATISAPELMTPAAARAVKVSAITPVASTDPAHNTAALVAETTRLGTSALRVAMPHPSPRPSAPPAPVAAAETAAERRTEIRIGTIALEVSTAAPAPLPAAAPVAATAPAPSRFSLQRHYLRWS
jgi:hypothetical protein